MKKANQISLDNLVVIFSFKPRMINRFEMLITVSNLSENVEYWTSHSYKKYKHNFRIKYNESALYIGVDHNSANSKLEIKGKIEYNPNKVDIQELEKHYKIITDILSFRNTFIIQEFDIAIDYDDITMNMIKYDRKGLRVKTDKSSTGNSVTLGTRQSTRGIVRIYDKRAEIKVKQGLDIGYNKTRLELNFKPKISYHEKELIRQEIKKKTLPDVFVTRDEQLDLFSDDKSNISKYGDTDYMLYLGVINGLYPVDDLSRVMRKNVKKILESANSSKLKYDYDLIIKTLYKEILKLT